MCRQERESGFPAYRKALAADSPSKARPAPVLPFVPLLLEQVAQDNHMDRVHRHNHVRPHSQPRFFPKPERKCLCGCVAQELGARDIAQDSQRAQQVGEKAKEIFKVRNSPAVFSNKPLHAMPESECV